MFSVPSEENVEKVIITRACVDGEGKPEMLFKKEPETAEESKPSVKKAPAKRTPKKTAKKTDA